MTVALVVFSLLISLSILGLLPWPQHLRTGNALDRAPQPWWRSALWVSLWLILPTYGFFYCRSFAEFGSPTMFIDLLSGLWSGHWRWAVGVMVLLSIGTMVWRMWPRILRGALMVTALALAAVAIGGPHAPVPSPSTPAAKLAPSIRLHSLQGLAGGGLAGLAMIGGAALAIRRGRGSLRGAPPAGWCDRDGDQRAEDPHPNPLPEDRARRKEEYRARRKEEWDPRRSALAWLAGAMILLVALAMATILLISNNPPSSRGLPVSLLDTVQLQRLQWLFAAALVLTIPLSWHSCGATLHQRSVKALQLALVLAIMLGLCFAAYCYFDHLREDFRLRTLAADPDADWLGMWKERWRSIWVPRYVGVIWPALGLAMAALFMRLPTRPLRWGAIALLLGVNLANSLGRIVLNTERPTDLMAGDIVAGDGEGSAIRTFLSNAAIMDNFPGRYYLCLASGQQFKPMEFKNRFAAVSGIQVRDGANARTIRAELDRAAAGGHSLDRIIVWHIRGVDPPDLPTDADDEILKALGPSWRRAAPQMLYVWTHMLWARAAPCRRVEYFRP